MILSNRFTTSEPLSESINNHTPKNIKSIISTSWPIGSGSYEIEVQTKQAFLAHNMACHMLYALLGQMRWYKQAFFPGHIQSFTEFDTSHFKCFNFQPSRVSRIKLDISRYMIYNLYLYKWRWVSQPLYIMIIHWTFLLYRSLQFHETSPCNPGTSTSLHHGM